MYIYIYIISELDYGNIGKLTNSIHRRIHIYK